MSVAISQTMKDQEKTSAFSLYGLCSATSGATDAMEEEKEGGVGGCVWWVFVVVGQEQSRR